MLRCPACEIPLCGMTYEGVAIQRCPDCGGCLVGGNRLHVDTRGAENTLTRDEVRAIKDQVLEASPSEPRACTKCLAPMKQQRVPSEGKAFLVDYCAPCAVYWFDRGELAMVQVLAEQRRHAPEWEDRAARKGGAEMALVSECQRMRIEHEGTNAPPRDFLARPLVPIWAIAGRGGLGEVIVGRAAAWLGRKDGGRGTWWYRTIRVGAYLALAGVAALVLLLAWPWILGLWHLISRPWRG